MSIGQILVIDNDDTARFLLSRVMYRMNRTESLFFAKNEREALELMGRQEFSLILLDLHQPNANGFELLQGLGQWQEATGKSLPRIVVLSSGDTDNAYSKARTEYFHMVSAHLEKPFTEHHVLQLLEVEGE
ncbi:response regulator [Rufibacter sediminis]|uniref:Response regulator n=1 Tax=Rufibacter sediminis TaxID=2762756 RepID=A0ABR6VP12_9BACT|nr:response regulator [Rufibacter sediminis]MBC3538936.1 response regulator [Rufibacter sediminis]